jgi:hypothetical protein
MALPAIRDSIDGLAADVAKEYTKRDSDGKFVLQVEASADGEGKLELADVTKLKKALESERTTNQQNSTKLAAFKDLDPTAAKAAIQKVAEMQNWKPAEEIENRIKLIKDELVGKHGSEKSALETKLKRAEGLLRKTLIRDKAVMAIQKAGGKVNLLLPHVEAAMRLREVEGNEANPYVTEIINPETGDLRIGDGAGSAMTLEQLIGEFKASDDFASAFAASGASGSGASNSGKGSGSSGGSAKSVKIGGKVVSGVSLDDISEGKVNITMDE